MKTYWRLLGFARPLGKYAVPYFFYTLLHAFFNLFNYVMIIPILDVLFGQEAIVQSVVEKPEFALKTSYLREIINYFMYQQYGAQYNTMQILLLLALFLITFSFFSNLFRYLGQRTMESMKIRTLEKIRNRTFDNVLDLQVGYFTNERKGDIISKITSDVQVVQFCITNTLQVAFRDPFLIIFYMLGMLVMSWQLTLFSVLYLPVVALVIGFIVKKLRRKATIGQETYADMVTMIDESVNGVKIIKAYNDADTVKKKFYERNGFYSRVMWSMAKRQQLSSPTSEFLGITAMSVLLLFGGKLVMDGSLTGSEFIAYLAIFSQITRPMRSFTDAFANINQGIAAGERVLELMDTKSVIEEDENPVRLEEFRQGIEFRGVRFSYENREVICGVDLKIEKGQTVALVGGSGGGKSTLSDLVSRFYDIDSGSILIDGVDIRRYSLRSLRDHIGIVTQDTVLFNDTIEENIRMGRRDATIDEIIAAAKVANAHEFIMETDSGYRTNIGDRGMKLSGGQRQRLSIARAVLKNPAILVLDEATSALDTESEKIVQQALDSLLEGRTSIVIAHRLSTVANADKIYVVEHGQIAEEGTHDQLMQKKGVYYKLIQMQQMV
ncbi:MAG: ABC transporter ATP-binding protein/permease [Rikenellaceae bacterium]|nr:ABC transporter ATP-binding protein/permease [Rikenellaceae bacterium]